MFETFSLYIPQFGFYVLHIRKPLLNFLSSALNVIFMDFHCDASVFQPFLGHRYSCSFWGKLALQVAKMSYHTVLQGPSVLF